MVYFYDIRLFGNVATERIFPFMNNFILMDSYKFSWSFRIWVALNSWLSCFLSDQISLNLLLLNEAQN